MNNYLNLGVKEWKISFRSLWYKNERKENGLRDEFIQLNNWPWRGLFWIAKDLSENRQNYKESIEPEAKDLVCIRNYLEHKYLTITEFELLSYDGVDQAGSQIYRIQLDDFYSKTIKIIKLAREALIYLSLGVHQEECKNKSSYDGLILPMLLDEWDDNWKK